jgi:ubiquinone/menaquinone biosynthesis C-methylase UbiE
VVAVDRSAAMVALVQKRLAGRARVIQGDVSNLREILADESFDLVLSSLVLHYEADLRSVFAECARLFRPAGTLVFRPIRFTIRSAFSIPDICAPN